MYSVTHSINHSLTHPAYLMSREPKLALRNIHTIKRQIYLSCSISVQFVHSADEAVDLSLLSVSAVVTECRDTTDAVVERVCSGPSDISNNETSAVVDSRASADKRLVPYCKTTVSSDCNGGLHVPDATHAFMFFSVKHQTSADKDGSSYEKTN